METEPAHVDIASFCCFHSGSLSWFMCYCHIVSQALQRPPSDILLHSHVVCFVCSRSDFSLLISFFLCLCLPAALLSKSLKVVLPLSKVYLKLCSQSLSKFSNSALKVSQSCGSPLKSVPQTLVSKSLKVLKLCSQSLSKLWFSSQKCTSNTGLKVSQSSQTLLSKSLKVVVPLSKVYPKSLKVVIPLSQKCTLNSALKVSQSCRSFQKCALCVKLCSQSLSRLCTPGAVTGFAALQTSL